MALLPFLILIIKMAAELLDAIPCLLESAGKLNSVIKRNKCKHKSKSLKKNCLNILPQIGSFLHFM